MNTQMFVADALERHNTMWQRMIGDASLIQTIARCAETVAGAITNGHTVFLAGNGGSFSDAQHIAAEFVGRYKNDRRPLPAVCLGTNLSTLTAVANDYDYTHIFARELSAFARTGDVVLAFSTSGRSPNILALIEAAQAHNITAWGLTGRDGGVLAQRTASVCIPSDETARIQEAHITVGHIVCAYVDDVLAAAPHTI